MVLGLQDAMSIAAPAGVICPSSPLPNMESGLRQIAAELARLANRRPRPLLRIKLVNTLDLAMGDPIMKARSAALGEAIRSEDGVGRAVELIRDRI